MESRDETFSAGTSLALIGVPSSAGARRTGLEAGPAALRAAGLLEQLRDKDFDVTDLGDLPSATFRPDPANPEQQNLPLVVDVARRVADRVDRALVNHRLPLVLGGDCSLTLGVIAGLLRHEYHLGLLYFDGDADLNTPDTTPSGAFDGMVLAHALGRGAPQLAGLGPRCPLLAEQDIVLFGFDVESGWVDPPELDALERSRIWKHPLTEVRADVTAAAREALAHLERRSEAVLVHFDVDVMNFPATDVPHPRGLDPEAAFAALRIFVASPKCAGLVVTELNAERDPGGSYAGLLAHGLVESLAARKAG